MKKPYWILVVFLTFVAGLAGQQTAQLQGDIESPEGTPLELANVLLYHAADSALISFAISDEQGHFAFEDLSIDTCFLMVSYIGYPEYYTGSLALKAGESRYLPVIQLSSGAHELAEVEVKARRKMFEIKPDKIVFNVEGTINAGAGNALDLLRKSPGVVVTNSDDITLLGQPEAAVYLDGKPSPLTGRDLAAHLRTLSAAEIASIEIITNPSARYDAEGSAGIINIRLKKDKNYGLNTNLSTGYSTGQRGWSYARLSSNYRNKTMNVFGEYGLNIGDNISTRQLKREQGPLTFDQSNTSLTEWVSHKFKAGVDFYLSEQTTLGLQVNGNYNDFFWRDLARTPIYTNGESRFDSVLLSRYIVDGIRRNIMYNLNYRFSGPDGASLIIDTDYSAYFNPNTGRQPNIVQDHTGYNVLSRKDFSFENPTIIELLSFKADFERDLLKGELGAGLKSTFTKTDNRFDFYRHPTGSPVLDPNRTNRFVYTEEVIAGYISYNREFEKISLQFGLRGEQTFSTGALTSAKQIKEDHTRRRYFNLFPSGGLTYKINPKNSLQLNYSRRINRPSYLDLNPFEIQKDEFNYERGNPFLRPEYTGKLQMTHAWNYKLYTSLAYSRTKDLIVRIRDTIGEGRAVRQWLNLAEKEHYSLNIGLSHEFAGWWSSYHSVTAYYVRNNGTYGPDQAIDAEAKAVNFYGQHSFSLPKSYALEISGWYNSPTVWEANTESDALWSISLGFRKKLWNDRGRISISLSDIFRSSGWYGVSRFGGLTVTSSGYSDSRRVSIYFSYLFGNDQVKRKKHDPGLDDELERMESKDTDRG